MKFASLITGTGAYIPNRIQKNTDFTDHVFYEAGGRAILTPTKIIIEKFRKITGISERRYAPSHMNASDMAAVAGWQALINSDIDPETLDQIVVAHNFGNVSDGTVQSQNVPSLSCRVKHILGINRPGCLAYDVLVGCPGWLHTVIQSHAWFRAGMAQKVLLIGTETLSRVIDPADRDSMIFSDGAGAVVMEYRPVSSGDTGILGCSAQTHSIEEVDYINMGNSYRQNGSDTMFIKMKGRKVYEYALKQVPLAMKECLDKSNISINEVNKILIHQANEKMDEEIVKRLYELYGAVPPPNVMPMSIQWLGNSSVATIPTLYHLIRTNKIAGHEITEGAIILFASVGAGMNINAVCYRV
ncbi:3-oxoacyl-ACP synthase III family protein [Niabella aquatica]